MNVRYGYMGNKKVPKCFVCHEYHQNAYKNRIGTFDIVTSVI